jgi:SAM-dependent methyltransferase
MKLVKIDPPGTWCHNQAVGEMIRKSGARTFIEVGCGAGDLSKQLCQRGMSGIGLDFSEAAIQQARQNLKEYIANGQYRLITGDIFEFESSQEKVDLGVSMMVMEHVEDDTDFLQKISRCIKPGGHVIVAVPGRRDCWTFEDETVGHLRRYDRQDLFDILGRAGLIEPVVWSVAVPTANMLAGISDILVRNSQERDKVGTSTIYQTQTSGIREIPFKTVFPSFCKLILNRYTLYPLFVAQRMFYNTGLGLVMLAMGTIPKKPLPLHTPEKALVSSSA